MYETEESLPLIYSNPSKCTKNSLNRNVTPFGTQCHLLERKDHIMFQGCPVCQKASDCLCTVLELGTYYKVQREALEASQRTVEAFKRIPLTEYPIQNKPRDIQQSQTDPIKELIIEGYIPWNKVPFYLKECWTHCTFVHDLNGSSYTKHKEGDRFSWGLSFDTRDLCYNFLSKTMVGINKYSKAALLLIYQYKENGFPKDVIRFTILTNEEARGLSEEFKEKIKKFSKSRFEDLPF